MKANNDLLRLFLILTPIPFLWIALLQFGTLQKFQNMAMDWRFRVRGELESPSVNLQYVNLDTLATREVFKSKPWSKAAFGKLARTLIDEGGARAVFFDIVFSDAGQSTLIDDGKMVFDTAQFAMITRAYPNILLATAYTTGDTVPYEYMDPAHIADAGHPERPTMLYYLANGIHQLGHINFDFVYSGGGAEPRWLPMFFRVDKPYPHVTGRQRDTGKRLSFEEEYQRSQDIFTRAFEADPDYTVLDMGQGHPAFMPVGGGSWFSFPPREDTRGPATYYHVSLELARLYHGLPPEAIQLGQGRVSLVGESGETLISVPLVDGQMLEIVYFTSWKSEKHSMASLYDVGLALKKLGGTALVPEGSTVEREKQEARRFFDKYKDAIVMIGPTDALYQDIAPAPFDQELVPKVFAHGNVVKQIFEGVYIRRMPSLAEPVIVALLTLVVAGLGIYSGRFGAAAKAGAIGVIFLYGGVVFYVFSSMHLVLPLIAPVGSAVTTGFAGFIIQLVFEEKQKGRIKGMFGTYVAPELVERMVQSGAEPELGGEEREVTAFFSDVQSFSSFSEILSPHKLVELMNGYLTGMAGILKQQGGTVDKYIGDAIVGIFNAPLDVGNHALRACVASQLMHREQQRLREAWQAENDAWPERVWHMQTRIGLNTGVAVVGNMGSKDRFNYTMMGDTVNLAARCESGAKSYGAYTMVTGETYRAAMQADAEVLVFRYLDKIVVKGRTQPAEMYEIVCLREDLDAETAQCLEVYAEAMKHYLAGDFGQALGLFRQSAELEPNRTEKNPHAPTTPSTVMLERCEQLAQSPPRPGDWDGIYKMTSK